MLLSVIGVTVSFLQKLGNEISIHVKTKEQYQYSGAGKPETLIL